MELRLRSGKKKNRVAFPIIRSKSPGALEIDNAKIYGLESRFRRLAQEKRPSRKDWGDSCLAAFAAENGLTLVTFDQALHRKSVGALLLTSPALLPSTGPSLDPLRGKG